MYKDVPHNTYKVINILPFILHTVCMSMGVRVDGCSLWPALTDGWGGVSLFAPADFDIREGGQAPGVFDMHNRQRLLCTKSKIFTLAYQ